MPTDPRNPQRRRPFGQHAEQLAQEFLRRRGLRICYRNYRCRLGELDMIARDGDTIVFVEVRGTASGDVLRPAFSIDETKQRRLWRLANYFLATHRLQGCSARFDVVLVVKDVASERPPVDLPPHALLEETQDEEGRRLWVIHYPDALRFYA